MSSPNPWLSGAVLAMCLSPLLLLAALSLPALLRRTPSERIVGIMVAASLSVSVAASALTLPLFFGGGEKVQIVSFGSWFTYGGAGFAFDLAIDRFSVVFAAVAMCICGVVSAFSFRYLHRDPGFHRYFVQMAMFVLGITLVALAGSIEVLLAGWELLGLSSALLVGFFHERRDPVRNALRVFAVYRLTDASMLSAAVLLHHWTESGSLAVLFSGTLDSSLSLDSIQLFTIAMLILIAVAGKSALLPFSGWLPRAMEGPTPSSAVFYGALSVHAGCFLLLRAEPLLAQLPLVRALALAAGVSTALYATVVTRVQTDIKSVLAFATLTQVGLIVAEISLGFTTLAFVHMIGHACFRLLQFLSAPNVLHDLHDLQDHDQRSKSVHTPSRRGFYLVALERGFVDEFLDRLVVRPFLWIAMRADRIDRILAGVRRQEPRS